MKAIASWTVVAVVARLGVSWACADSGVFADMTQYHDRALHLLLAGTLPDALRGPGYPALLALTYGVFGASFWHARVANALVGGVLTLVTGWLARRAGAGPRAWVASAIVALYPALVLSSVYLMPEGLYTLLAMLALLLVRHRAPAIAVAAGAVTGLAILTRSVGLALVASAAAVAAWTWWQSGGTGRAADGAADVVAGGTKGANGADASERETGRGGTALPSATVASRDHYALLRLAAFVVACAVVLAPWLRFTTRVAGGPLLDTTSGMNVLLGNHDAATGRLNMADDQPLRQRYVVGAVSEADANTRALRAGLAWAVAHPAASVRLAGAKLAYLLGLEGREHAWGYSVGYFGERRAVTVTAWGGLLLVSFPLLVVAAAWGLVRAPGPLQPVHIALAAFVAATCVLHVASFGESRFHLPLVPVLAVAASLGGRPRRALSNGDAPVASDAAPDSTPGARPNAAPNSAPGAVLGAVPGAAPDAGPWRAGGWWRLVLAALVVVLLAVAWMSQLPELLDALNALRQPGGWATPRHY